MINDYNTAARVVALANRASAILHEALGVVMNECSQAEFETFRKAVARPMAEVFLEVIKPIGRIHTDLDRTNLPDENPATREEAVPAYDPKRSPPLVRLYHAHRKGREREGVLLQVHNPVESDEHAEEWYCEWSAAGERRRTYGNDGIEALINAIREAQSVLERQVHGKDVEWKGGMGIGLLHDG